MKALRFKNDPQDTFFLKTLQKRVNAYFNENGLKKTANKKAIIKAGLLFTAYSIVYLAIFFSNSSLQLYVTYSIIGVLTIFVALNIAHDAAHSTFSDHKKVNDLLLHTFDFLGANGYLWQLKHVHSHHPHVNIPDMDGDIKQSKLVRIFPNAPFLKFHRFQYLYMPFLYLFYTLVWLLFRDFKDFFQTEVSGKPNIQHPASEYVKLIFGKMMFILRLVLFPYLLLPFSIFQILLGFAIFHFSASFTVALALISTHVGEHSVYPEPDEDGKMEHSWVRHQIITTCDFATKSKLLTNLFGGFNHHVVHHLFPNICHIHYPQLTKILVQTCHDFSMPYYCQPTLKDAVLSHWKFLKIRSKEEKNVPYMEM